MAYTYLDITNQVLRRFNEVQLTSSNFADVKGFHAQVKDAVNASIRDIYKAEVEWPFLHTAATITSVVGQQTYDPPSDCEKIDWDTFFLYDNSDLTLRGVPLKKLSYDQWVQTARERDYIADASVYAKPTHVFRTQSDKIGLSPKPDTVNYRAAYEYWAFPIDMVDYDDVPEVPERYRFVIVDGAMSYSYYFRGVIESAAGYSKKFKDGINQMRTNLINRDDGFRDTRVIR